MSKMKPFPFVLGTDIIRITRFDPIKRSSVFVNTAKRVLHSKEIPVTIRPVKGDGHARSLHEWLTLKLSEVEHQEAAKRSQADIAAAENATRFLAGRWAAKEAARKAWGASILSWKDVTVRIDYDAPSSEGTSRSVKIVCQPHVGIDEDFGESERQLNLQQEGRLSISHDGEYCVATVIAEPLKKELLSIFKRRISIIAAREGKGWEKPNVAKYDTVEQEVVQQETTDRETSQDEIK